MNRKSYSNQDISNFITGLSELIDQMHQMSGTGQSPLSPLVSDLQAIQKIVAQGGLLPQTQTKVLLQGGGPITPDHTGRAATAAALGSLAQSGKGLDYDKQIVHQLKRQTDKLEQGNYGVSVKNLADQFTSLHVHDPAASYDESIKEKYPIFDAWARDTSHGDAGFTVGGQKFVLDASGQKLVLDDISDKATKHWWSGLKNLFKKKEGDAGEEEGGAKNVLSAMGLAKYLNPYTIGAAMGYAGMNVVLSGRAGESNRARWGNSNPGHLTDAQALGEGERFLAIRNTVGVKLGGDIIEWVAGALGGDKDRATNPRHMTSEEMKDAATQVREQMSQKNANQLLVPAIYGHTWQNQVSANQYSVQARGILTGYAEQWHQVNQLQKQHEITDQDANIRKRSLGIGAISDMFAFKRQLTIAGMSTENGNLMNMAPGQPSGQNAQVLDTLKEINDGIHDLVNGVHQWGNGQTKERD